MTMIASSHTSLGMSTPILAIELAERSTNLDSNPEAPQEEQACLSGNSSFSSTTMEKEGPPIMFAALESPQAQQAHTFGSEPPQAPTSNRKGPSINTSTALDAPQLAQRSNDVVDQFLLSTMNLIWGGSPAQVPRTEVGQPFPFLKLPRELRDKIYRSLLVWRYPLKSMRREDRSQPRKGYEAEIEEEEEVKEDDEQKYKEIMNADFGPVAKEGIFGVNKQIYEEAQAMLYRENEFVYEEHIVAHDLIGTGKRRVKRPLCEYEYEIKLPGIFKQARDIRAEFSTWGNTLLGDFVQILLQNPNLRRLHIDFRHPNVSTMKEIRKKMKKLGKLRGLEEVELSLLVARSFHRHMSYVNGTKREQALTDCLKEVKTKMLAK